MTDYRTLSLKETAEKMRVSKYRVRQLVRAGKLTTVQFGETPGQPLRNVRILESSLDAFYEAHVQGGTGTTRSRDEGLNEIDRSVIPEGHVRVFG